jgi:hypothetical protein
MMGGIVSCTVTVKVALDEWPNGSDAVHMTGVVPMGKVELGCGEQTTLVPGGLPWAPASAGTLTGQPLVALPLSIAVGGMKKTHAPPGLVAGTTMLFGTVLIAAPLGSQPAPIAGGTVSSGEGTAKEARNVSTLLGSCGIPVTSRRLSASIDPL